MMTSDRGAESTTLSPDDAFSVLGNETRMNILRTLGEADGRLSFSELYDRIDVGDSGQFNYHLEKLVGHFIRKTDEGYDLQQAGIRVVEAVLSGAITDTPVLESTMTDLPCPYCGEAIEVSYRDERLLHRCTECPGSVGGGTLPEGTIELGYLPPAGTQDRTPREMVGASATWAVAERVAMSNRVCPRCAGVVDHTVDVCEDHSANEICEHCNRRHAVYVNSQCRTCRHEKGGVILRLLIAEPTLRAFFERQGLDLFSLEFDNWGLLGEYDEEVLQTDPFEARFTFEFEGDTITLTVDDDLHVTDVERDSGRNRATESGG